jgi:HPt (histidine-containing phosphotransfer) domain-containing protein
LIKELIEVLLEEVQSLIAELEIQLAEQNEIGEL